MSNWFDDLPTTGSSPSDPPGSVGPPPFTPPPPPEQPSPAPSAAGDGSGDGASTQSSGKLRRIAGGVLAAVAVGAGGFVGWQFFAGGGASSPEGAVEALVDGIVANDLTKVAASMNPNEVRLLNELAVEVGNALDRAANPSSGAPGLTVKIDKLRYDVDEVADDVAVVEIDSLDVSFAYDTSKFGGLISKSTDEWTTEIDERWFDDYWGAPLQFVAVKEGRGWYLSPVMTAAHTIRELSYADLSKADWDAYVDTDLAEDGADDPEGAIELLADAVSSGDPQEMAAALPSDQGRTGFVFADAIEDLIYEETGYDRWADGFVTLRDFDVEEDGEAAGMKRLRVDSFEADVSSSVFEEGSGQERYEYKNFMFCDESRSCNDVLAIDGDFRDMIVDAVGGHFSLMVRKADGGWKVDPVASVLDNAVRVAKGLDGDAIASLFLLDSEAPQVVQPGETVEFETNDFRYGVVSIPTDEPVYVSLHDPNDGSTGVGEAAVLRGTTEGWDAVESVVEPDDGEVRIGIRTWSPETFDLSVTAVGRPLEVDVEINESTPTGDAVHTFTAPSSGMYRVIFAADQPVNLQHSWRCDEDGDDAVICDFDEGESSPIVMRSHSEEAFSYALKVEEARNQFSDGSQSVSVPMGPQSRAQADFTTVTATNLLVQGVPYYADVYIERVVGGTATEYDYKWARSTNSSLTFELFEPGNYRVRIVTFNSGGALSLVLR